MGDGKEERVRKNRHLGNAKLEGQKRDHWLPGVVGKARG